MIVRQYAPCSLGRSIICLGKQGEINALRVHLPIRRGDVLISNILESDADVVATQDLK